MIDDENEFRRQITEADRQAKLASEYAGNCGQQVKQTAEKFSIDRKAINMVRTLARKPPAKRDSLVCDLLDAFYAAGFFNHTSLIEDGGPRERLQEIAKLVAQAEPEEAALNLRADLDEALD